MDAEISLGPTITFTVNSVVSYGLTDDRWNAISSLVQSPIEVFLPKWISQYICPGTIVLAKDFAYSWTTTGLATMERSDSKTNLDMCSYKIIPYMAPFEHEWGLKWSNAISPKFLESSRWKGAYFWACLSTRHSSLCNILKQRHIYICAFGKYSITQRILHDI